MTLIGVSTLSYDLYGAAVLRCDPHSHIRNLQGRRRATRTPTLDGGASVYDSGFCNADHEIVISTSMKHLNWLARIVKVYSLVLVVNSEGVFKTLPYRYWVQDGRVFCEFQILTNEAKG